MFSDRSRPTRLVALMSILKTKMIKGTPIRDHMIHIIALFNEIEILGVELNGET